jgi:hypothetical protein
VGFLKVAAPDFARRDLSRYCQHRSAAAVRVEQTIDEVKVAGPARAGAYRKSARDLRLARSGEGGHFLVSDVDPLDRLSFAQRLSQAVQAVADHTEDARYSGLNKRLGDQVCHILDLHGWLSLLRVSNVKPAWRVRLADMMFDAILPRKAGPDHAFARKSD